MDEKCAERNIKLFYLFTMFEGSLVTASILLLYISNVSGMTLSEICFMESVAMIETMLLQIPFGALADVFGRKKVLVLGSLLIILQEIFFFKATNKLMIWISNNVFWVFAYTLISGADSSFIYDNLKFLGREKEFKEIKGRAMSYLFLNTAIFSVLGGYLAELDIRFPAFVGILTATIPFCAAIFFVEPPREKVMTKNVVLIMKEGTLECFRNKKILWLFLFGILINTSAKLWFFTYNDYFEFVELPLKYFGWMFFLVNLSSALSSKYAEKISDTLGNRWSFVAVVLFMGTPMIAMGLLIGKLSSLFILLGGFARGFLTPFIGQLIHQEMDSEKRATVLSAKSSAEELIKSFALSFYGYLLVCFNLSNCLLILGISVLVVGAFIILAGRKFQHLDI